MEEVKNCVYRFVDKNGKILYVGSTELLLKHRLSSHNCGHLCDCCKKSTDKVEYIVFPTLMDIRVAELYYINKYQPPYNTQHKHLDGISYTIDQLDNMDWTEYKEKISFMKQPTVNKKASKYTKYDSPYNRITQLVKYYKENNKEEDE